MVDDARFVRTVDDRFGAVTNASADAVTEDARVFAEAMYFRDLAWVYEPLTQKNSIGASQGVIDYHRYPAPLPIHVRRITARYAGGITLDTFAGARDGEYVSEREAELCFPLGTVVEPEDKVYLLPRGRKPGRWYTIVSIDDGSTDALMVVTRGESIGIPDGITDV